MPDVQIVQMDVNLYLYGIVRGSPQKEKLRVAVVHVRPWTRLTDFSDPELGHLSPSGLKRINGSESETDLPPGLSIIILYNFFYIILSYIIYIT